MVVRHPFENEKVESFMVSQLFQSFETNLAYSSLSFIQVRQAIKVTMELVQFVHVSPHQILQELLSNKD